LKINEKNCPAFFEGRARARQSGGGIGPHAHVSFYIYLVFWISSKCFISSHNYENFANLSLLAGVLTEVLFEGFFL